MISEISQTHQYLNSEINEAIEKLYLNINISSKEQKEKGILELQKTFLEKLSKNLEKSNKMEISDLVMDKSIKISETTGNYDWPSAETLKVPNLYRNTNLLYIYVKSRLNLLSGKGKIHIKDGALKGAENIIKILNCLIEDGINLEDDLIYLCFEDLFSFYCLSDFNEKAKEQIDELILLFKEETNISGLARMENIDKNAESNFFRGTLATLLKFKIDLVEENKDMELDDLENIFKHEKVLRNNCFLAEVNFVWGYSCYKYIVNENKDESFYQLCEKCIELLTISKNYKEFLLPNKSNIINLVQSHIEKLRSLIIIYFVNNLIFLNDTFFMKLDFSPEQIKELMGVSITNLSPLIKIVKDKGIKDYHLLKFDQKIIKQLEKNSSAQKPKELKEKFNNLIIAKSNTLDENNFRNNADYLKFRLRDGNNKYVELLNF